MPQRDLVQHICNAGLNEDIENLFIKFMNITKKASLNIIILKKKYQQAESLMKFTKLAFNGINAKFCHWEKKKKCG